MYLYLFYQNLSSKTEILSNDCELTENYIIFVFSYYHNNANESNPVSDSDLYVIEFDCILNEFVSFYYE